MDEEPKKPYQPDQPPFNINPFLGLDLGERWGREIGELSQRVSHLEVAVTRLDSKFDVLDAKVDKIAYAFHRLDERMNNNTRLVWGLFTAILLAIIAQRLI